MIPRPSGEIWRRVFGASTVVSRQEQSAGLLVERFGPLSMYLEADVDDAALIVRDLRATFCGLPLPPALSPAVDAVGRDDGEDIAVQIRVTNPLLGLLVAYSGKIRQSTALATQSGVE